MEQEKEEKIIKEVLEELLKKMGFSGRVEVEKISAEGKETIVGNIQTEDSNFLIGQFGVNLQALQHIARIITRKKTDEKMNFIVDVNSYRQEKNESVEKMARELADQAVREKRAVVMRPMSSYERRIVHMELAKNTQIKTESIGEGESRKVVIKPTDVV